MKTGWMVVAGLMWAATGTAGTAAPSAKGSCVTCHRTAGESAELAHTFSDWSKSVHAVRGVSCEGCHGGDATKDAKDAAHAGIKPSADPQSRVYFSRVPETCGRCHSKELEAFRQSRHFRELQTTGKGPNCVTCHGAMANHILEPRVMDMTCTLCHRRPTRAYGALASLNNAMAQVRKLKRGVERARAAGVDASAQERELKSVAELVDHARVEWHTFTMTGVLTTSQEVSRRVVTAMNELKLKGLADEGGNQ